MCPSLVAPMMGAVAVTGLLFFGAISHGYGLAFEHSALQMGALLLIVAVLTWLMPARTYQPT